ncbi:MAG: ATP-dependent Clp protease proteolytic subunit [Synergistaceae bacterium]|nr:ATP-dependent Clp protease proteolytic subunit [Synergistaceae bacterium]
MRKPRFIALLLLCLSFAAYAGAPACAAVSDDQAGAASDDASAMGVADGTKFFIADISGIVGVPLEEHVQNVFSAVGNGEDSVLIFRMNTPGGLVDSMSEIMSAIAEADFPVVVWVTPSGARAASAGAFIMQSAHIAVMAPGTNIGAAHPVTGGGDIEEGDMKKKVTNDLTAKMRSFAQERGRNVEAAESMVTESVSFTAREALEKGVIDFIAADEDELFSQLDGMVVEVKGHTRIISTENRDVTRIEMTFRLKALELFSRPDIAYMALLAGIFLIILEAKAPGGFVMGATGGMLLLMAAYGMRVLPVNFAGIALLLGGILLITLDIVIGGMGIIAAVGIAAMLTGGLMLFDAPGAELLNLSTGFVIGVTLVIAAIFLLIARLVVKALRKKPASGLEAMAGERLKISGRTEQNFMAFVHGEYWRVLPLDPQTELTVGDEVEVVLVESLTLFVKLIRKG